MVDTREIHQAPFLKRIAVLEAKLAAAKTLHDAALLDRDAALWAYRGQRPADDQRTLGEVVLDFVATREETPT